MKSVNEPNKAPSHKGVTYNKSIPYLVEVNSEVGEVLKSLFNAGDLSKINPASSGNFTTGVYSLVKCGFNPFEAFVYAFYNDCEGVYIPAEFSSMENTAWTFSDNARVFDKLVHNSPKSCGVGRREYDPAMKSLSEEWGKHNSHWEDVVRAFWKFKS